MAEGFRDEPVPPDQAGTVTSEQVERELAEQLGSTTHPEDQEDES